MSVLLPYKTTQVAVYDTLLHRQQADPSFNFSLRRKFGDDDADKGLFIGTRNSGYFAFTLWAIPLAYNGATGDLLDYAVRWNKDGTAHICLHYQIARSAGGHQNAGNLGLAEALQNTALKWTVSDAKESNLKMTHWGPNALVAADTVAGAMIKFINDSAHLVDKAIAENAAKWAPAWQASRINTAEFKKMQERMLRKRNKWFANVPTKPSPTFLMNFPLNQILYGPPGTGKTYHTTVRAIGLVEGRPDAQVQAVYPTREALRLRYEELQQVGRIQFVTFHQAFSYEDFVEGIKPVPPATSGPDDAEDSVNSEALTGLQYALEAGVFKRLCETAAAATTPEQLAISIPFDELYDGFAAQLEQQRVASGGLLILHTKEGKPVVLTAVNKGLPGRLSFHHSTSTGQDHHQDKSWIKKIYDKYSSIDQITHLKKHLTEAIGGTNASLQYVVFRELKKHEAQRLTEERRKLQKRPAPRFVLIIDEINRGNVANIFGELITLLEDDKRAGRPEALTVKLPYSKKDFTVPENLYLLGTMNTADRSVEALDTALRRRFSFSEMRPEPQVIRDHVGVNGVLGEGPNAVDLAQLLEVLNSRLEQLLDRDHCLGHALLLHLTTLEDLRAAFQRNILPLLQEYFFGDWGKIGLVLGARFVEVVKANAPGRFALAPFPGYEGSGARDKPLYRLTPPETWDAAAFQSIYPAAPAPAV